MAQENNELNDIVKRCKILLLDIEGTTTSISFVKETLFPYVEENLKSFFESQWDSDDVKGAAAALRKQAVEDQEKSVDGLVAIPGEDASKDEQIEGLVKNVKWQMTADRKAGPLKQLQGLIWKLGYDKGDIKGHVYDDVFPALELWTSTAGQKVYIYSSGSVQAQKLLFKKSLSGDMLPLIEGHFDTAVGAKQEAASYAAIVEKIGCKAEDVLFLTDIVKEAEAARASGLQAAIVSREGNAPLPSEATTFPILHSFEQLTVTNKRKTEPQTEGVPAKVPKTDNEDVKMTSAIDVEVANADDVTKANTAMETIKDDVKTTSAMDVEAAKADDAMETTTNVDKAEEPMEVEETPVVAMAANKDETNKMALESKTAIVEVADISKKEVPIDDAVVSAVTDTNPPVEATTKLEPTDEVEAKVDNANKKKVKNSHKEASPVKAKSTPATKNHNHVPETQIKMVDAATLTEGPIETLNAKAHKRCKKVDAATETEKLIPEVAAADKTKAVFTPIVKATVTVKQPKVEDFPIVTATVAVEQPKVLETLAENKVTPVAELTTATNAANDTKHVLAVGSKDMNEVAPNTQKMEVTSIDKVKEVIVQADTAVSKSQETINVDVKTIKPTIVGTKTEEGVAVETSDGVDVKVIEKSDSLEAANPQTDETSLTVTDTEQNEAKLAAKPVEIATEAVLEEGKDQNQKDEIDVPACKHVVENMENKTELNETEKMETEATVSAEKVETVKESKEPSEKIQQDIVKDAILTTIEVQDITDDKESLNEVTDIVDDVVPIIEEPSHLEEMEELQNAGDVLEKECDEILLKVQDVTNMDFIPVKPLHTIAEEMETDNMDSNDIVERILDTEMELSMKSEDIDLNTVQEMIETKTDTDERIGKVEPGTEKPKETLEGVTNEKIKVSSDGEIIVEQPNENKIELEIDNGVAKESLLESVVEKMETEVVESVIELNKKSEKDESSTPQESKTEMPIVEEVPTESDKTEAANLENKESDKASLIVTQESTENSGSQDAKMDDATDTKVNGKTNGNAILKLNGNASQNDNVESRLTADAVKEKVNGSNGDSANAETGQGDNKVEAEIPDIKVKMAAKDDAHTQKEQPVEA